MSTWIGIDIGTSAVKVALVRAAYRKMSLEALVTVDIAGPDEVVAAVRSAVLAAHAGKSPTGDGIAVAIEGTKAAIRVLTMPSSVAKQLTEVLAFELESQVPFEMDSAVFDHLLLTTPRPVVEVEPGAAPAKISDRDLPLTVLVGVARTDDVRARIDLVTAAINAEPERVGIGPFAVANLVPFIPALAENGPVVVVDIGRASSEVLVLRAGEPVFTRTLSDGTLGLPASAPRLAREIRVSIAAHRAAGGAVPTAVFLCGGGAFESSAESFFARELELPVSQLPAPSLEIAPTFIAVGSPGVDPLATMPRYAKAIGLAVGLNGRGAGLNLRRGQLAYERGFGWVREKIPMLAGLSAVVAISFFFAAWTKLYAVGKDEEVAGKALATVTRDVLGEETRDTVRAQELLSQQTNANDEDPMPRNDAFDVMIKLSEAIPTSMVHDIEELDIQKGHVVVHGIVGSIPDAQSIAQSLGVEKCFQDVKVKGTHQMIGTDRQKYDLEFEIKCPEDVKGKKKSETSASGSSGSGSASPSGGGK
jgi:general secretion pathway protein L